MNPLHAWAPAVASPEPTDTHIRDFVLKDLVTAQGEKLRIAHLKRMGFRDLLLDIFG